MFLSISVLHFASAMIFEIICKYQIIIARSFTNHNSTKSATSADFYDKTSIYTNSYFFIKA